MVRKLQKLTTISMMVVLISPLFVVAMPGLAHSARADGMPITKHNVYATLRENRQLAYITVSEKTETIDLFLNVASLEPREPVTIVLPLRTMPQEIQCEKMSDRDFESDHHFSELDKIMEKQTKCNEKFMEELSENSGMLIGLEIGGPLAALFMATGFMGGAGGGAGPMQYRSEGVSVDVHSFNSAESLGAFYESLNLTVPKNVQKTITKYYDYHIAVINITTKPPIASDKFDALRTQAPSVMSKFKEYVKTHPTITIYSYGGLNSYDKYYSYYYGGTNLADNDLRSIYNGIKDYTVQSYFYELILATYGLVETEGFQLSFKVPLHNGKAYFPLGTSPAWGAITTTKIIFECSGDKEITFSNIQKEAFYKDRHYYIWRFSNAAPNYDLEGKIQNKGLGTHWSEFTHHTSEWIYDNAEGLSIWTILGVFVLVWFVLLVISARSVLNQKLTRQKILKSLGLSVFATFLCMGITIYFALPLIVYLLKYHCLDYKRARRIITLSSIASRKYLPNTTWGVVLLVIALAILPICLLSMMFLPQAYVEVPREGGWAETIHVGCLAMYSAPAIFLLGFVLMSRELSKIKSATHSIINTLGIWFSSASMILAILIIQSIGSQAYISIDASFYIAYIFAILTAHALALIDVLYLIAPRERRTLYGYDYNRAIDQYEYIKTINQYR